MRRMYLNWCVCRRAGPLPVQMLPEVQVRRTACRIPSPDLLRRAARTARCCPTVSHTCAKDCGSCQSVPADAAGPVRRGQPPTLRLPMHCRRANTVESPLPSQIVEAGLRVHEAEDQLRTRNPGLAGHFSMNRGSAASPASLQHPQLLGLPSGCPARWRPFPRAGGAAPDLRQVEPEHNDGRGQQRCRRSTPSVNELQHSLPRFTAVCRRMQPGIRCSGGPHPRLAFDPRRACPANGWL